MYYYLLYNSSFSFIVENRLFSTILYGSILYILTHAVLNYCDVSILTIINHYFWTLLYLDIISFSYAIYNTYINNGFGSNGVSNGSNCESNGDSNDINDTHSSGNTNHLNVSFNLLKNKINTMLDRKNDLTITHIPQHKNNLSSNNTNNSKSNQPKKNIQENFNNVNNKSNNNYCSDLDFSNLDDVDIKSLQTQSNYSTPITQLKNNLQGNLNNNIKDTVKGNASTPISIIRSNVKIDEPIIHDNLLYRNNVTNGNTEGNESVAGSDVGSIMDLEDFEKSF